MKRFIYHLLFTALALTTTLSVNAKITGKLIDADDKSPLIEATIKLVKANRDSTFMNGATSNVDGTFSIPVSTAGKYVLKVTYLGYNNVSRAITVPQSGSLALIVLHFLEVLLNLYDAVAEFLINRRKSIVDCNNVVTNVNHVVIYFRQIAIDRINRANNRTKVNISFCHIFLPFCF